jgi:hypothetical protein
MPLILHLIKRLVKLKYSRKQLLSYVMEYSMDITPRYSPMEPLELVKLIRKNK